MQATLRVVVALQCWGMAAAHLHQRIPSRLLPLLEEVYRIPPQETQWILNGVAWGLLVAGAITLFRPAWFLLAPIMIWQALHAACGTLYGAELPLQAAPLLEAPQIFAPLALLLIDIWPPTIKTSLVMARTAATFLLLGAILSWGTHGWLTLSEHENPGEVFRLSQFVARDVVQYPLSTVHLKLLTRVIACLELMGAACLLCGRVRLVALLMTLWGLVFCLTFSFADGLQGYHESLLRASSWGGLLMVWQYWMYTIQEQPPIYQAETETH